jgi:TPP-dependent pyruvate/acetoin dehydrogenase alpha subunit
MARPSTAASSPANARQSSGPAHGDGSLSREQKLELYYYMRLTRSLEERLVNLYRQTKVVGGLFRSLGQEADAVGSAYALDRSKGDVLSPLIRNLGSMLVGSSTSITATWCADSSGRFRIWGTWSR